MIVDISQLNIKQVYLMRQIILSFTVALFLVACGRSNSTVSSLHAGEDTPSSKQYTITGKVVAGYIQDATVCLDMNGDGYCQEAESPIQSDENGSYALTITKEMQEDSHFLRASLLAYGGVDKVSQAYFDGKLMAPLDGKEIYLSPISTLSSAYLDTKAFTQESRDEKLQEVYTKMAQLFTLEGFRLSQDPMQDRAFLEKNLVLEYALEYVNKKNTPAKKRERIAKLYKDIASSLDGVEHVEDLIREYQAPAQKYFDSYLEAVREDFKTIENSEKLYMSRYPHRTKVYGETGYLFDLLNVNTNYNIRRDIHEIIHEVNSSAYLKNRDYAFDDYNISSFNVQSSLVRSLVGYNTSHILSKAYDKARFEPKIDSFQAGQEYYFPKRNQVKFVVSQDGRYTIEAENIYIDTKQTYYLEDGQWIAEGPIVDEDNTTALKSKFQETVMANREDISQKRVVAVNGYGADFIEMPQGAEQIYLGVKTIKDYYTIWNSPNRVYENLDDLLEEKCQSGELHELDGSICHSNSKIFSSFAPLAMLLDKKIPAQKIWEVKSIEGVEMLVELEGINSSYRKDIFTIYNHGFYKGTYYKKGLFLEEDKPLYNKVAFDAIAKEIYPQ